jgi:hypothetical protein
VRWQLARGDTSEEAWQYCDAPPLNAADTERGIAGLVRYVGDFIREIGRHVRF